LAVRLEVLNGKGASPLPRTNPRYGHPTPTTGVEVERKWARPDYVPLDAPTPPDTAAKTRKVKPAKTIKTIKKGRA